MARAAASPGGSADGGSAEGELDNAGGNAICRGEVGKAVFRKLRMFKQSDGEAGFWTGPGFATSRRPNTQASVSGRYWARTSDPQLVELVLSQLS
jgi:hypothetical protein